MKRYKLTGCKHEFVFNSIQFFREVVGISLGRAMYTFMFPDYKNYNPYKNYMKKHFENNP